jgi:hypothetical protein
VQAYSLQLPPVARIDDTRSVWPDAELELELEAPAPPAPAAPDELDEPRSPIVPVTSTRLPTFS